VPCRPWRLSLEGGQIKILLIGGNAPFFQLNHKRASILFIEFSQMSLFNSNPTDATTKTIRIAVVDDHSIMRAVYRSLVDDSPELEMAWSAASIKEARLHIERDDAPDVMIMDVTLPDGTGYEMVKEVLVKYPTVPILMVSAHEERTFVAQAVECGARGYLVKDSSPAELMDALETVLSGETYFKPGLDLT
jgi:CheY-like chemotaxis protein